MSKRLNFEQVIEICQKNFDTANALITSPTDLNYEAKKSAFLEAMENIMIAVKKASKDCGEEFIEILMLAKEIHHTYLTQATPFETLDALSTMQDCLADLQ